MPLGNQLLSRRDLWRIGALVVALVAASLWASFALLEPAPPSRIVLASGAEFGLYHVYAQRYRQILARDHVTVEERMTAGAGDNLRLLLDPKSGVDVAFLEGGIATFPEADSLVMLASLYYEPLWVFYRGPETLTTITQISGKRAAVGLRGSGTRAFVSSLLAINDVNERDTTLLPLGGRDALRALQEGTVDAAIFVGGAMTPTILDALRAPHVKLMSMARADAYVRRFPYLTRLTLPAGTIAFAQNIPERDVTLIGTKAMLAARDGLHPALVNLLSDAAREIHSDQGYFEAADEFPSTAKVDLRVSSEADRHRRFGPSLLYRYLPFWVATFVERAIIVMVPLLVIMVPLLNFLPQFLRWRIRSRIYRWYGELVLLERDVGSRTGPLPIDQWLVDLDRIEQAAQRIKAPMSFASEAYTLREHIGLVRRAIMAKRGTTSSGA